MPFLYESEIEDWFHEAREELDTRLYADSLKHRDIKGAKERYDRAFTKLLKRYEREHLGLLRRTVRRQKLSAPFKRYHAMIDRVNHRIQIRGKELQAKAKRFAFDLEYRMLMRR